MPSDEDLISCLCFRGANVGNVFITTKLYPKFICQSIKSCIFAGTKYAFTLIHYYYETYDRSDIDCL